MQPPDVSTCRLQPDNHPVEPGRHAGGFTLLRSDVDILLRHDLSGHGPGLFRNRACHMHTPRTRPEPET